MTYSYYILLYTVIYDFCTTAAKPVGGFHSGRGGAQLQGADLYRSLHQYMSEHCKALRDVSFYGPGAAENREAHQIRNARACPILSY